MTYVTRLVFFLVVATYWCSVCGWWWSEELIEELFVIIIFSSSILRWYQNEPSSPSSSLSDFLLFHYRSVKQAHHLRHFLDFFLRTYRYILRKDRENKTVGITIMFGSIVFSGKKHLCVHVTDNQVIRNRFSVTWNKSINRMSEHWIFLQPNISMTF